MMFLIAVHGHCQAPRLLACWLVLQSIRIFSFGGKYDLFADMHLPPTTQPQEWCHVLQLQLTVAALVAAKHATTDT